MATILHYGELVANLIQFCIICLGVFPNNRFHVNSHVKSCEITPVCSFSILLQQVQARVCFCSGFSDSLCLIPLLCGLCLSLSHALSLSPSGLSGFRARLHSSSSVPNFLKFLAPVVESDDTCDSQRKRYSVHFHILPIHPSLV